MATVKLLSTNFICSKFWKLTRIIADSAEILQENVKNSGSNLSMITKIELLKAVSSCSRFARYCFQVSAC